MKNSRGENGKRKNRIDGQESMKKTDLDNLLLNDYFRREFEQGLRGVCADAMLAGIPVPAFASALSWYDGYRSARLPANLPQAQRDYFGAHMYERTDAPRGAFFHTQWSKE